MRTSEQAFSGGGAPWPPPSPRGWGSFRTCGGTEGARAARGDASDHSRPVAMDAHLLVVGGWLKCSPGFSAIDVLAESKSLLSSKAPGFKGVFFSPGP